LGEKKEINKKVQHRINRLFTKILETLKHLNLTEKDINVIREIIEKETTFFASDLFNFFSKKRMNLVVAIKSILDRENINEKTSLKEEEKE